MISRLSPKKPQKRSLHSRSRFVGDKTRRDWRTLPELARPWEDYFFWSCCLGKSGENPGNNQYQSQKACSGESYLNVYYFIALKYYLQPIYFWIGKHLNMTLLFLFLGLTKFRKSHEHNIGHISTLFMFLVFNVVSLILDIGTDILTGFIFVPTNIFDELIKIFHDLMVLKLKSSLVL